MSELESAAREEEMAALAAEPLGKAFHIAVATLLTEQFAGRFIATYEYPGYLSIQKQYSAGPGEVLRIGQESWEYGMQPEAPPAFATIKAEIPEGAGPVEVAAAWAAEIQGAFG